MQTPSSSEQHLLIQTLEHTLLHSDFRQQPQQLDALLATDFMEIGITGQITTRSCCAVAIKQIPTGSLGTGGLSGTGTGAWSGTGHLLCQKCSQTDASDLSRLTLQFDLETNTETDQTSEQWQLCFHQATAIHSGQDVPAASC
ncbi:MAG: hypothetical protein R3E89_01155 [Thiolinea sp.]